MLELSRLPQLITDGLITGRMHPSLPLTIYNYTAKCQHLGAWDDTTKACRGLIVDDDGVIVARPFPKFFNLHETDPSEIPWHLDYEITEKMDGSLFIATTYKGHNVFATRGSFESEQAIRGEYILNRLYPDAVIVSPFTYCFEVIYPENRIVVNYGVERLVLLAIFLPSGQEWPIDSLTCDTPRRLPKGTPINTLKSMIADNEEGYVVRFENGFRLKVKGDEYLRLHRLMFNVSNRTIWQYLSEGRDVNDLIYQVPDEFMRFVQETAIDLINRYNEKSECVKQVLNGVRNNAGPSRKEQARWLVNTHPALAPAVFRALDGKDYSEWIWKQLCPAGRRLHSATEVGE